MARITTNDISRMVVAGQTAIFTENFNAYPLEYPGFSTKKKADKQTVTFDSMGNLGAATEKVEGTAINYGKVEQAYQTSIKMKTWANGMSHTMEAIRFDLYGVIASAKAKELARTMRELEEYNAVYWLNNADNAGVVLTDGVPLASNSHPCKNAAGVFNDTLTTGALTPTNVKTGLNMFNDFKNHAGGPMKSVADKIVTHRNNMFTVEEIFGSPNKAYELSNTANVLPAIKKVYSTYMTNQSMWILEDSRFEHVLFAENMPTAFDQDEDKINTKDMFFNAVSIYNTGCLPNIGIVVSTG